MMDGARLKDSKSACEVCEWSALVRVMWPRSWEGTLNQAVPATGRLHQELKSQTRDSKARRIFSELYFKLRRSSISSCAKPFTTSSSWP